ncbi:MAG: carboxypeptidase-like regulatory domain-containing protein [Bacteroidetes bacterium]|nr:MAG: carboxypeptidase-like regulatory domain-containing protein [Bacteroidota bacterium]
MKIPAIFIFFLFFSFFAFAQRTIKGKVVASANGAPVAGCSVFINNTSKGTASDKNGNFELNDISPGKHELVVSSIGYETSVYPFNSVQLPLQLKIELQVKVKELGNVIVEPSVEEGWDKWGKTFTDNFIGTTPNASHCKIKNQKAIHFRYYKKSNRVIAYSDEPLIFENKALGYRISYQLEEFEVNFKTRVSMYYGYPYFEDMETGRKSRVSRWQRNRDKAYYGSMMHFMRSLYIDSMAQQGFEVRRMFRTPNEEKERVKKIHRTEDLPADSIAYYERILGQPDYKERYAKDLLTGDSLIIGTEGPFKILFFTDYIYVTYKNEIEDRDYLVAQRENRQPTWQRSYLTMPDPRQVEIDINGSYPPQDILAWGYWSWSEKMADFLPLDYEP